MKRIAVIGDISGFGRCSLTAALPVISYLGIECCPFPTAVLSAQTGFSSYHFTDLTGDFKAYESQWEKLGYSFDGILTGYIASAEQADLIADFIEKFKKDNTILLVDPVMADDGEIYGTYTKSLCKKVTEIAKSAHIITPNLSELCILAGIDYQTVIARENDGNYIDYIKDISKSLLSDSVKSVIVTGVRRGGKIHTVLCEKNKDFVAEAQIFGGSYSGTGDLLASVILGKAVLGVPLEYAVSSASEFLERAVESTYNDGSDRNCGVNFQQFLEVLKK